VVRTIIFVEKNAKEIPLPTSQSPRRQDIMNCRSANQRLKKQPKLGLLEILGSGRSDPFSAYPIENLGDYLTGGTSFDSLVLITGYGEC
jgi:hypothetical protein